MILLAWDGWWGGSLNFWAMVVPRTHLLLPQSDGLRELTVALFEVVTVSHYAGLSLVWASLPPQEGRPRAPLFPYPRTPAKLWSFAKIQP